LKEKHSGNFKKPCSKTSLSSQRLPLLIDRLVKKTIRVNFGPDHLQKSLIFCHDAGLANREQSNCFATNFQHNRVNSRKAMLMSTARFHVFLSHNSADKPAVEELARRLKAEGLEPWFDKWDLILGQPWQQALEKALDDSDSVAVFIGPSGFGPWQNEEMRVALAKRVSESKGDFRVIPVLLPGAVREERSRIPSFLLALTWVEFRKSLDEEETYHRLKSGITG
jgi:hypothetical protein